MNFLCYVFFLQIPSFKMFLEEITTLEFPSEEALFQKLWGSCFSMLLKRKFYKGTTFFSILEDQICCFPFWIVTFCNVDHLGGNMKIKKRKKKIYKLQLTEILLFKDLWVKTVRKNTEKQLNRIFMLQLNVSVNLLV